MKAVTMLAIEISVTNKNSQPRVSGWSLIHTLASRPLNQQHGKLQAEGAKQASSVVSLIASGQNSSHKFTCVPCLTVKSVYGKVDQH